MFAGQANVSTAILSRGVPGVSCDCIYGGKAMDMTTTAGMAFFDCNWGRHKKLYNIRCPSNHHVPTAP